MQTQFTVDGAQVSASNYVNNVGLRNAVELRERKASGENALVLRKLVEHCKECPMKEVHDVMKCEYLHPVDYAVLLEDRYVRLSMLVDNPGKAKLLSDCQSTSDSLRLCDLGRSAEELSENALPSANGVLSAPAPCSKPTSCRYLHIVPNVVFIDTQKPQSPETCVVAYRASELGDTNGLRFLLKKSWKVGKFCVVLSPHRLAKCNFNHYGCSKVLEGVNEGSGFVPPLLSPALVSIGRISKDPSQGGKKEKKVVRPKSEPKVSAQEPPQSKVAAAPRQEETKSRGQHVEESPTENHGSAKTQPDSSSFTLNGIEVSASNYVNNVGLQNAVEFQKRKNAGETKSALKPLSKSLKECRNKEVHDVMQCEYLHPVDHAVLIDHRYVRLSMLVDNPGRAKLLSDFQPSVQGVKWCLSKSSSEKPSNGASTNGGDSGSSIQELCSDPVKCKQLHLSPDAVFIETKNPDGPDMCVVGYHASELCDSNGVLYLLKNKRRVGKFCTLKSRHIVKDCNFSHYGSTPAAEGVNEGYGSVPALLFKGSISAVQPSGVKGPSVKSRVAPAADGNVARKKEAFHSRELFQSAGSYPRVPDSKDVSYPTIPTSGAVGVSGAERKKPKIPRSHHVDTEVAKGDSPFVRCAKLYWFHFLFILVGLFGVFLILVI